MNPTDFSRRLFLKTAAGGVSALCLPPTLLASNIKPYQRLLILVELKGANDGLNTVIPYADPTYLTLRPTVNIARDKVLQLDEKVGLHPALDGIMPLWADKQLAVVEGLGYPQPNLSHFRSIEIWDTASKSDEYLQQGWLARAFGEVAPPATYSAEGVIVGSSDLGPLLGAQRAVTIQSTDAFLRQARLAAPQGQARNAALAHVLKTEGDIQQAAKNFNKDVSFKTEFPRGGFGDAVKTAMQVIVGSPGVAVVRVSLGSFDTHQGQLVTHQGLLKQLGDGLAAFKSALTEKGRWQDTLIMTYCEFGRRAKENLSGGTDHGTANVQFALGGAVKGGLYGARPSLTALTGDGNFKHTTDFRRMYASALGDWWGLSKANVARALHGDHAGLEFLG